MSTNLQDYVELLNAEQHVQVDKLQDHARHGIAPLVRGEVWMYLLNVLSEDKTNEITTVMALESSYTLLPSSLPSNLSALLLKAALEHHTHRFFNPTYAGLISSTTAENGLATGNQASTGQNASSKKSGNHHHHHHRSSSGVSHQGSTGGSGIDPRNTAGRMGETNRTSSGTGGPTGGNQSSSASALTSSLSTTTSIASNNSSNNSDHSSTNPTVRIEAQSNTTSNASSTTPKPGGSSIPPPPSAPPAETQTLRTQYGRFLPPPPAAPLSRHSFLATIEEVLGKFYHSEREQGRDGEYRRRLTGLEGVEKDWVWMITPFMCCLTRPTAIYLGFQKLMERTRSFPPISSRLAMFLTLFKMAIPELFLYFEDEQVPYQLIALSWVRTLFAKEMWLGNVMRLWDAYLAVDDMFELHCYVCVAVLATCKETLEELDGSEVKLMLLDLPPLDIDRLLQDAANLRVTYPLPRPVEE